MLKINFGIWTKFVLFLINSTPRYLFWIIFYLKTNYDYKDAEKLYKAGEGKWGTDEDAFIKVLANQNLAQLQMMFNEVNVDTLV